MKKVILYGIQNAELRAKVNNYLADGYEISGISDSFLDRDHLQEEHYIKPNEISSYEYDYVLILSEKEKNQGEIRDKLIELNVNKDSIVVPRLLLLRNADFIPDLNKEIINKIEKNDIAYEAAVMGLSYSLRGIDFERLCLKSIDFSWHGLDLYYNYKQLELLLDKDELNIQTFIMVFPYYYLNYDMSSSFYQYSTGQIFACRGFQDWHNARYASNSGIQEYLISEEMFGEKFWKYKKWKKVSGGGYESVLKMDKVELPKIWKMFYKDTCKENENLLQNILKMLKGRNIIFVIPPIFLEIIQKNDLDYYYAMRKYFLDFLKKMQVKYEFNIVDFSEKIKDLRYFSDYCHLNELGKSEFTNLLNQYFH